IAAYVSSLGKPADDQPLAETAENGGGLFASFACIACHTPPDFAGKDTHARIPLAHVGAKFNQVSLVEFLKLPALHSPFIRMPNFRLADEEARSRAAYLYGTAKAKSPGVRGDAGKGATLAATAGCANCHTIPRVEKSTLAAPALSSLKAGGCLAE